MLKNIIFFAKKQLTFIVAFSIIFLSRMITDKDIMFRNTKQKQCVMAATKELCHPTAHDIYLYVREHCPSVSKGTVYRGLASLVDAGKVHHIKMPNGADCYDWKCDNHYHLVCRKCGMVFDVDIPYMEQFKNQVVHGAYIEEHTTLFYGECPRCYQQGKKEN